MYTFKKKALDTGLQRRVRARREPSEDLESEVSDHSINGDLPKAEQEGSGGSDSSDGDDEVCSFGCYLVTAANRVIVGFI
jgi:ribosomal RNA-processing protein 36